MRGLFNLDIKITPVNIKEILNTADVKTRNMKIDLGEINLFFDTYINPNKSPQLSLKMA
jgi:hypothetical protein